MVFNLNLDDVTKEQKKLTLDYKKTNIDSSVNITNAIKNQVEYIEKGNDIIVNAYATQEVKYQKVVTEISPTPEAAGKYKGKYACTVTVFNAIYDDDGIVTGFDEEIPISTKTTYLKNSGDDTTTYQTLNSKNKVIFSTENSLVGENKIIADEKTLLSTITYKNGTNDSPAITLNVTYKDLTSPIYEANLINTYFAAVKSGKNYKGSWLKEVAVSTSDNETFALGTNKDIIEYDMSLPSHGKDTVKLASGAELTVNFTNESGNRAYTKNGNDVILKMLESDYNGSDYVKVVRTVQKNPGMYHIIDKAFFWNEAEQQYVYDSDCDSEWDMLPIELTEVEKSMGIKMNVGENIYYVSDYNTAEQVWHQTGEEVGSVTFKNYLKLEEDSVAIGNTSLKTILDEIDGIGILNYHDAAKKQSIKGTFLNEQITGSQLADTLTTGKGNDTIYLSAGKDTVTIDGNGIKTISNYEVNNETEAFTGETTIKFNKNSNAILNLSSLDNVEFVKSANDMIVEQGDGKINIKDFFKQSYIKDNTLFEDNKTFDNLDTILYQKAIANKAANFTDTEYEDFLKGGDKADKFTVANGNTTIDGGKSNDTISVTKNATDNINIIQSKGTGNDILSIANESDVKITIDGSSANGISFEKTGTKLIFNTNYTEGSIKDSLTINNYFKEDNHTIQENNYQINYTWSEFTGDLSEMLGKTDSKYIKVNGVKEGSHIFYDGTDLNDEFTLDLNKKSNFVINCNGGNNKLVVTSDVMPKLFFNVSLDENDDNSELILFNDLSEKSIKSALSGKVTGGIAIIDYKANKDDRLSIYKDNQNITESIGNSYDAIKEEVAGWLEQNSKESTIEVFMGKDQNAIKELCQIYSTAGII